MHFSSPIVVGGLLIAGTLAAPSLTSAIPKTKTFSITQHAVHLNRRTFFRRDPSLFGLFGSPSAPSTGSSSGSSSPGSSLSSSLASSITSNVYSGVASLLKGMGIPPPSYLLKTAEAIAANIFSDVVRERFQKCRAPHPLTFSLRRHTPL